MSLLPIQTERLLLRDFAEGDWRAVHAYAADPEASRYMEWGPNDEAQTRSYVAGVLAGQKREPRLDFDLAVTLRGDGRLIGGCGFHISSPSNREAWIGYVLNHGFWGQGYATEAARALLVFGFERFGLHRIYATCDPRNLGSARVLEKVGMLREGRLRENKWQKGEWRDSFVYAILEQEYRSHESGDRMATS
jgi:RimJ/RimL family protein N-acetyltransferase